jgi:hypothetical protein
MSVTGRFLRMQHFPHPRGPVVSTATFGAQLLSTTAHFDILFFED